MVSAGGQDTGDGSFDIKVPGLYETIDDVLNTPVKTNGDSVITFRDIAEVKRTFEDRQSYANVNGSNSITINNTGVTSFANPSGFYDGSVNSTTGGVTFSIGENSNAYGRRYVSTSSPSGGSNGDIWFRY